MKHNNNNNNNNNIKRQIKIVLLKRSYDKCVNNLSVISYTACSPAFLLKSVQVLSQPAQLQRNNVTIRDQDERRKDELWTLRGETNPLSAKKNQRLLAILKYVGRINFTVTLNGKEQQTFGPHGEPSLRLKQYNNEQLQTKRNMLSHSSPAFFFSSELFSLQSIFF